MNKKFNFNWNNKLIQLVELMIDLTLVLVGYYFALSSIDVDIQLFKATNDPLVIISDIIFIVLANIILLTVSLILFRMYQTSVTRNKLVELVPSLFMALFFANIITYLFEITFRRDTLFSTYIISFVFQLFLILVFKIILFNILERLNKKHVIVVGPKEDAEDISKKVVLNKYRFIRLKYIFNTEKDDNFDESLLEYINKCDYVVLSSKCNESYKNNILTYVLSNPKIDCIIIPKLYEIGINNSKIQQINNVITFEIDQLRLSLEQQVVKRIVDIILSTIGIIITSPIMLIAVIIIKLLDKGSIFERKRRMTVNDKEFNLYKLRTKRLNSKELSRFGKFIKKLRIDEIPQLFNVLIGDMSLVGPRAEKQEIIFEKLKLDTDYSYVLNVKPGITGLAQVRAVYGISPIENLRYDIFYLSNYSLINDIGIMLLAIKTLFNQTLMKRSKENRTLEEILDQDLNGEIIKYSNIVKIVKKRKSRIENNYIK